MKNIMKTKVIMAALLLFLVGILGAELLPMHVDYHRYLDSGGNTLLLLDYQVVYRNLSFVAKGGGFFAEMEVKLEATAGDSTLFSHRVTDNIGISNKYDAASEYKNYLNRIVFQYDQPLVKLVFEAKDINSGHEFVWQKELEALQPDSRISDIELNARVYADSSSFTQKFQRGGKVYEPQPAIIVNKSNQE